jgi:hypothetical protein
MKGDLLPRSSALQTIFISYRRGDSEGEAGRLSDDLAQTFQEGSVFMDVNAIQPGRDFRKAIDESIHKCSVLLAVVGRDWLESKNASGQRRLDDESDFVRLEIASALQRDIPVVPVLVRGARMPRAEQLPADLRELAYRNAVELTHARWKSDVRVLIQALRPYMGGSGEELPLQTPSSGSTPLPTGLMQKPVVEAEPTASATGIERAILERVGRDLAGYIGPIAEIVVRRAAKRCTSVADLCALVAQEIDSSADRAKFLASCRR